MEIEGIKDYEIYLENCKDTCYNKANKLENYLAMFTCENYEDMKKLASNDKEALRVVQELEKLSQEKYFGGLYDARIVQRKLENSAKEEGRQEGALDKSKEIAKTMLKKGMDVKIVSECTGLCIDDINDLKD